jgi:hypothetical protein
VLVVKGFETKTVMSSSLPMPDRPNLLEQATRHLRGRPFWFKSLDQDMTVIFSGHAWAGKNSAPAARHGIKICQ